jgi:ParB-like chromosome segregation protein Spo0J
LEAVEVDGRIIVTNGHHRLNAAKEIGFKGKIPYKKISVEESGYTLEQLREAIR